jgi:FHA domain-containing protein
MIVLGVISYKDAPVSLAPVSFDELGGTIGRANTNQLVLPDEERTISRVHAHIVFRNGCYALIDRGGNAVIHNGQTVSSGREVVLSEGDEIQIGAYRIVVSGSVVKNDNDPFSDFSPPGGGLDKFAAPMVAFNASSPAKLPSQSALQRPVVQNSAGLGIPDDWDPFKQDEPALSQNLGFGTAPQGSKPGLPDFAPSVSSGDSSLDSLFGLSSSGAGADPLAGSAMLAPKTPANTSGDLDPFKALQKSQVALVQTVHDHDSDMNSPWQEVAPRAKPAMQAPAPSRSNESSFGADVLVKAFLAGLGAPNLRLRKVDEQAMMQLGKLLRESTKGTVELLAARTSMKKEVRAEVTVMATVANNPLKFSPTTELALQYLLGPETPGFMSPAQSMQDAYDDLKAHQLGVMAGMRAALTGILKRFDPAALEGKVASHSGFASLIPSTRKAQLWEQFQELYDQLYSEAEDNFEELFGNAFAKEYERYVAQLNAGSTKR